MYSPFAFIKQPASVTPSVYEIYLSNAGGDSRVCALEPNTRTAYYTDDINFNLGSIIYVDVDFKTPFDAGSAFYSTYDDRFSAYNIYVQINRNGVIVDTGICK